MTMIAEARRLLPALFVLAAFGAPLRGQERHTLRAGDAEIWNLAGRVTIEAGSGSDVEVEVRRRGSDGERLRIETGPLDGRSTLRVIYPEREILYRDDHAERNDRWSGRTRTQLYVDRDGTFGGRSRGERVEIRSYGEGMDASADLLVRMPRGARLRVHLAAGEAQAMNVEGDLYLGVHAAAVQTRGTRGSLELDTGSGEVRVTDASGDVTLDSGSGAVTLEGVKGGALRLSTGSGSVRANGVEMRSVNLETGSGRVTVRDVRAPDLSLETGSGSVEVQLAADVDRLRVETGSGSVTIGVPESLGATLRAETGSGGIDFGFPVEVTRQNRRYLTARLGDGRGEIDIETGSGSIRFRRS